jgi:hypothetical protein
VFNVKRNNANNNVPLAGFNLFTLGQTVTMAGQKFDNTLRSTGAVLFGAIQINCDLDKGENSCFPTFLFTRIDTSDSPGYNFRSATKNADDSVRTLVKYYGVRMVFVVTGIAGRFDVVALFIAIGSGIGLFSVASLVCDFVMMKLLPDRKRIIDEKIELIAEDEDPQLKKPPRGVEDIAAGPDIHRRSSTAGALNIDDPAAGMMQHTPVPPPGW